MRDIFDGVIIIFGCIISCIFYVIAYAYNKFTEGEKNV
jgi:hypothetical protein